MLFGHRLWQMGGFRGNDQIVEGVDHHPQTPEMAPVEHEGDAVQVESVGVLQLGRAGLDLLDLAIDHDVCEVLVELLDCLIGGLLVESDRKSVV